MAELIRLRDLEARAIANVRELVTARGWAPDPDAASLVEEADSFGEFTRTLDGGFTGRLEFDAVTVGHGSMRDGRILEAPTLAVGVEAGLVYEPADRVLRSLGQRFGARCVVDMSRVLGSDRAWSARFSDLDAADRVVQGFVSDIVDGNAVPFLRERASVDGFVGMYRQFARSDERFVVPVVLGAAGRIADALDCLDAAVRRGPAEHEPDGFDEFSARVRSWLNDGATVPAEADVPPRPVVKLPPRGPDEDDPIEVGSVTDHRRTSQAERDVFQLLRKTGTDVSREERRALLVRELGAHGIVRDPIWIETTLDRAVRSDGDLKRERNALLFGTARLFGSVIKSAVTGNEDALPTTPDWMQAPSNTWPRSIRRADGHALIELDNTVGELLHRVWATRSLAKASVPMWSLEVWLAWDPTPRVEDSRLVVHIGKDRVGIVPEDVADGYVPMIEATQIADSWPRIDAELARLDSGEWLLQIPVPANREDTADKPPAP